MRIILVLGTALLATLPSVLISSIWLKRRGITPGPKGTVPTFMEAAPMGLKIALISFNFVNFVILCGGGWYLLDRLVDG